MPKFRKKPVVIEAEQFAPNGITRDFYIPGGLTHDGENWVVDTLEGKMIASPGDWIITGVNGEKYPCKPGIFEKTYEPASDDQDFGWAIRKLKEGATVARRGWNGKNMFLYYVPEGVYPARTEAAQRRIGMAVEYGAYIAMKTAQGNVVPWLASQTDVLATDWVEV